MLTNFRTIRSRLQRLEQLEAMEQDGTLESESKKQASRLKREMRKIRTNLDGVRRMTRLPGAVIVVDAKKEYLALREAGKLSIPTVGILDTDSDPDTVDVAIPANDDSIRAVEIILNELADAVAIGKTMVSTRQQETGRGLPRRVRPEGPPWRRQTAESPPRLRRSVKRRESEGPVPPEGAPPQQQGEQTAGRSNLDIPCDRQQITCEAQIRELMKWRKSQQE
jgi:small subunit ribosomal protein S2